jgi:hypothetical protein
MLTNSSCISTAPDDSTTINNLPSEPDCFMLAYPNQFAQDLEIFSSIWMNSLELLPAKKKGTQNKDSV